MASECVVAAAGEQCSDYSDRSACSTSTRDARAAGISDASDRGADEDGGRAENRQHAGQLQVLEIARGHAGAKR